MTNGEGHTIYMLGIGGIGMSALARYYQSMGYAIAGYDRTKSRLTFQLEKEGMAIHYEDRPELLPESIDMVIYTPAVPHDLKEFEALRQRELPILKRSEALGKISKDHFTIAVSGTHGKTTTTAMIAHILNHSRLNTTAFIGGIAKNFDSNLLLGKPKDSILVVEADEFDRSFLQLHPDVSIIGSIDADHLDIYGAKEHLVESFNDFAKLTKRNVIVREGLEVEAWNKITYGFGDDCKYQIILGNSGSGYTMFYIKGEGQDKFKIIMPLAGIHNVLNATAAFIAARRIGVSRNAIAEALHTFMGVKRRFDVRINTEKYCYIDDYAHHPEEIRSCLQAIRDFYPNRRLTLVFQPHLYSRTRDFMDEFAEVLATADELILLDIYAAREEPLEGVSSQVLLDKIQMPDKKLVAKTQLIKLIDNEKPELLVTMGAGDIDRYVELFEELIKSW